MNYKTTGYLWGTISHAAGNAEHEHHSLAQGMSVRFRDLESHFFDAIHSGVDVGLAVDQGSKRRQDGDAPHIMTVHGGRHVSDVIRSVDKIARYIHQTFEGYGLDCEEAYILLCAAHLHDAGNIGGRDNHPARSGALIAQLKNLFLGTQRREQVFEVASVHGGSDPRYGPDTLRSLNSDNYQRPRLPLLAAILRLGDELSENPERVPEVAKWHKASGKSNLAYRYSLSFRRFDLAQEQLFVTLKLYPVQHNYSVAVNGNEMTFCDYLEDRLNKMELEVRYCSQYGRPYLSVRTIRVSMEYHEEDFPSRPIGTRALTLELERGYPQELRPLTERCEELREYGTFEEYCRGAQ